MGRRPGELIAIALVLLAALLFRFGNLAEKPLHNDEAVQGYKTGLLLESGTYRYDPTGHHGPTLYFLDLPIARLRGESTLAELSEVSLRLLPALAGLGSVLAVLALRSWIGAAPALIGAAFLALSPLQVYFSRHYVQEPLLTLFSLLALLALLTYARRPRVTAALSLGLWAGLIHATKETSLIIAASFVCAILVEAILDRRAVRDWWQAWITDGHPLRDVCVALTTGGLISFLFYSSFLRHPGAFLDAFTAWFHGAGQSVGSEHAKPAAWYLELLVGRVSAGRIWSELLVLALALFGIIDTFRRENRRTTAGRTLRFIGVFSLAQFVVYSLIPYKTPWLMMVPEAGFCILASAGAVALLRLCGPQRIPAAVGTLVLALGLAHLGLQARRSIGLFAADARNPLAYVQTVPDLLKAPARLEALTTTAGRPLSIKVMGEEYWPLPWYLRSYPDIGYWNEAPAHPDADVIISTAGLEEALEPALRQDYSAEYIGLRPGVVLLLRTRLELWETYVDALE